MPFYANVALSAHNNISLAYHMSALRDGNSLTSILCINVHTDSHTYINTHTVYMHPSQQALFLTRLSDRTLL